MMATWNISRDEKIPCFHSTYTCSLSAGFSFYVVYSLVCGQSSQQWLVRRSSASSGPGQDGYLIEKIIVLLFLYREFPSSIRHLCSNVFLFHATESSIFELRPRYEPWVLNRKSANEGDGTRLCQKLPWLPAGTWGCISAISQTIRCILRICQSTGGAFLNKLDSIRSSTPPPPPKETAESSLPAALLITSKPFTFSLLSCSILSL